MRLRYWRARLRIAGWVHRRGSTGDEWRCRLAERLHGSYEHGSTSRQAEKETA
jgi:hypothetical protein